VSAMKWWMRVVGGFYLLTAAFNTPWIIEARFNTQYPEIGISIDSAAAQALVDTWFMFGLEVAVIGAALIYFSRDPERHLALVWTVIALEAIRGIADDIYLLSRGYDPLLYSLWIVIHLAIIVSGLIALRRVSPVRSASETNSDQQVQPA
jgi:hypothetical protein